MKTFKTRGTLEDAPVVQEPPSQVTIDKGGI